MEFSNALTESQRRNKLFLWLQQKKHLCDLLLCDTISLELGVNQDFNYSSLIAGRHCYPLMKTMTHPENHRRLLSNTVCQVLMALSAITLTLLVQTSISLLSDKLAWIYRFPTCNVSLVSEYDWYQVDLRLNVWSTPYTRWSLKNLR